MSKKEKNPDLTVWVAEDSPVDALDATNAVLIEAKVAEINVDVYWDKKILWDSLLSEAPPAQYLPQFDRSQHLPTVVILDLFADEGFLAQQYFRALRRFEDALNRPRSWVILWSVKTSLADAHDLLFVEPYRDRKLMFTSSKTGPVLREKLMRCFRSWKEETLQ